MNLERDPFLETSSPASPRRTQTHTPKGAKHRYPRPRVCAHTHTPEGAGSLLILYIVLYLYIYFGNLRSKEVPSARRRFPPSGVITRAAATNPSAYARVSTLTHARGCGDPLSPPPRRRRSRPRDDAGACGRRSGSYPKIRFRKERIDRRRF